MDIDKMTRLQQVEYFRSINGDAKYETLNEMIKQSEKVVFFGGAGVSTESGISDFRSKDGLCKSAKNPVRRSRAWDESTSGYKPLIFFVSFCIF